MLPTATRHQTTLGRPASRRQIEDWLGTVTEPAGEPLTVHLMCPAGASEQDTILCMVEARSVSPAILAQRTGGLVFGADLVVCLLPMTPHFQCPRKAGSGVCDCTLAIGQDGQ